jgi:hypothetical protein
VFLWYRSKRRLPPLQTHHQRQGSRGSDNRGRLQLQDQRHQPGQGVGRDPIIVGGYAVSFHAQPRATKDLDILIGADAENSKAVFAALAKFGALVEGLSAEDFAQPDNFFRMGTPPVMVDIMPKISGVELEEAWRRRVDIQIDDDLSVGIASGGILKLSLHQRVTKPGDYRVGLRLCAAYFEVGRFIRLRIAG